MKAHGIFFDLYGTLLLYGDMPAAWQAWLAAFRSHLKGVGLEMERKRLAELLDDFIERPEPPLDARGSTVFERRVFRTCAELGVSMTDDQVTALTEASIGAWQQFVTVDPVAHDVLTRLGTGHTLALVSNFDHEFHVYGVLDEAGLTPHFESIIVSSAVDAAKPDPRIFAPALAETGLRPEDVVYIGDADVDVAAARGAGIRMIRIRRDADTNASENPDGDDVVQIRSLRELLPLLED